MPLTRTIAASALLCLPLGLAAPALADEKLIGDINSARPEAQEDCEALRESLADQRDDGTLLPRDYRELRDKGC